MTQTSSDRFSLNGPVDTSLLLSQDVQLDQKQTERQETLYREEKRRQMVDRNYSKPGFYFNQYIIALVLHTLYHQVLGPFLTLIIIPIKGKTYAQNFGFWPGVFTVSFIISTFTWVAYLTTAFLLFKERYLGEEIETEKMPPNLFDFTLLTLILLIRNSTIAVRHGTTAPTVYRQWMDNDVQSSREDTLLLVAWGYVSPEVIETEIVRQMDIFGADIRENGFEFKVLTPLYPVTRDRLQSIDGLSSS